MVFPRYMLFVCVCMWLEDCRDPLSYHPQLTIGSQETSNLGIRREAYIFPLRLLCDHPICYESVCIRIPFFISLILSPYYRQKYSYTYHQSSHSKIVTASKSFFNILKSFKNIWLSQVKYHFSSLNHYYYRCFCLLQTPYHTTLTQSIDPHILSRNETTLIF